MKSKFLQVRKMLLVAAALLVGASALADTKTLLDCGTDNAPWTDEVLATWTGKEVTIIDNSYVQYTGTDNGDFATTTTITPTKNAIINLTAVWRGRSNTGRYWSNNCGLYFRYGNIVVAQNDQDQTHGYVLTGLSNLTDVTTFKAGSYRTDIANCPWLKIEAEINTATNTLTSFTIKSEDGTTTYVELKDIALSDPDYATVAFGFQRGDRHTTEKQEQLKSVTVTETSQEVAIANYTINYTLDEAVVKTVSSSSVVGEKITAETTIEGEGTYEGNHYLIVADAAPSITLVAEEANNVLNVPVRAPYTATLTLTTNIGGVAQEPTVTTFTETDDKVCAWSYAYPLYVQKDGVYYVADVATSFGESGTFTDGQSINKEVKYTTPDYSVIYFGEPNETAGTNFAYSNGNYGHTTAGGLGSVINLGVLPAGKYHIITNVISNPNRCVIVSDCSDATNPQTLVGTINKDAGTGKKDEPFTLTTATPVCISGYYVTNDDGSFKSFNQGADVDYILVKASELTVTIGATGYTTFASTVALDLDKLPESVTAYYASNATGESVVLTEATGTVAAGTGLILTGTTVNIPVATTSGEAIDGNLLVGCVAETPLTKNENQYVLADNNGKAEFQSLAENGATIPAGKAYLDATEAAGARTLSIVFGGETTGIAEVAATGGENGAIYNLSGQRISKPANGLYIVNGKKVVLK